MRHEDKQMIKLFMPRASMDLTSSRLSEWLSDYIEYMPIKITKWFISIVCVLKWSLYRVKKDPQAAPVL